MRCDPPRTAEEPRPATAVVGPRASDAALLAPPDGLADAYASWYEYLQAHAAWPALRGSERRRPNMHPVAHGTRARADRLNATSEPLRPDGEACSCHPRLGVSHVTGQADIRPLRPYYGLTNPRTQLFYHGRPWRPRWDAGAYDSNNIFLVTIPGFFVLYFGYTSGLDDPSGQTPQVKLTRARRDVTRSAPWGLRYRRDKNENIAFLRLLTQV